MVRSDEQGLHLSGELTLATLAATQAEISRLLASSLGTTYASTSSKIQ